MKKIGIFLLILTCLLPWGVVAQAVSADTVQYGCSTLQAKYALSGEETYSGTAKSALLYELNSQTLVYAYEIDEVLDPSGLVKIMTALVALETVEDLEQVVTVRASSINSLSSGAKRLGLAAGDTLTVRDLLYCVMVYSANDAAAILADHVCGSQDAFVEKMNDLAATLGCENTNFANVHGLSSNNQYSTAREMAIITEKAMENEEFVEMFSAVNYQLPETVSCTKTLTTTNDLQNPNSKSYDSRVIGGKPAKDSKNGSMICVGETESGRYLSVVLSTTEKTYSSYSVTFSETLSLLKNGFQNYALQQVLSKDEPFAMYEVHNGENDVAVGTVEDVYALLPVHFDGSKLSFRDSQDEERLSAPVRRNTVVGQLTISYGSMVIAQVDLVARYAVAANGTTIQTAGKGTGSAVWQIILWIAVGLCILAGILVGVMVLLRQKNLRKHQRRRRRSTEQEYQDELD